MKMRNLVLSVSMACAALSGALVSSAALAQDKKVQFFPVLSGRTGPVAPNATP
ncbi:MAG: hypothetical protein RI959_1083, partial [Pseudomonadota bacterium]